jgi:hypothetical protein
MGKWREEGDMEDQGEVVTGLRGSKGYAGWKVVGEGAE